MVMEVTAAPKPVTVRRTGTFGVLPAEVATPLAMVLTELVQNAVEHGGEGGDVEVAVEHGEGGALRMQVRDRGPGLPDGFSIDASDRLGLHIVRTLVDSELGGQLELVPADGGGTVATVVLRAR